MKYFSFIVLLFIQLQNGIAQTVRQNADQAWWNVVHYYLQVRPDFNKKFISGSNQIRFRVLESRSSLQIDLQQPLQITSIDWKNTSLKFERNNNNYKVQFPDTLKKGSIENITIYFEGVPKVSVRAPWDNGWIWATDKKGRPWMSVTCEGSGASIWFPCKDILGDEPDSGATVSITVPDSLVAVANGRLQQKTIHENGTVTYTWAVVNTINNYNIIPYIGKYTSWHKTYAGEKGPLDCDFWVLDYSLEKAKEQFLQADTMLHCFEYWMGPYPFYEDGYKLVEAPNLGMEHQSAIAYGNDFGNGFKGRDLSGTGRGLRWDFILVHESGHEWFGNSITALNDDDSWIHEGFTKYLETIYTASLSGAEAGNEYARGITKKVLNDQPIVGSNSSDKYNKTSALLHMIRQLVGDTAFRKMLRGLNKTFYHRNVSTEQVIAAINDFTGHDFTRTCNQYLRTIQIPVLEYRINKKRFEYRWTNCIAGFDMPFRVSMGSKENILLFPSTSWQQKKIHTKNTQLFSADINFYVETKRLEPAAGN